MEFNINSNIVLKASNGRAKSLTVLILRLVLFSIPSLKLISLLPCLYIYMCSCDCYCMYFKYTRSGGLQQNVLWSVTAFQPQHFITLSSFSGLWLPTSKCDLEIKSQELDTLQSNYLLRTFMNMANDISIHQCLYPKGRLKWVQHQCILQNLALTKDSKLDSIGRHHPKMVSSKAVLVQPLFSLLDRPMNIETN